MTDDQFTVDGIFQAKVTRKSDTVKGIYLTLEISGDDYSPALAQLRAGSLLKMGWQELVDVSVQPMEREPTYEQSLALAVERNRAGLAQKASKPKKRFEDYPLSAQCAMRTSDDDFIRFLCRKSNRPAMSTEGAAEVVRHYCGVDSRSELSTNEEAAERWRGLERDYQNWLTDQRHAESVRR